MQTTYSQLLTPLCQLGEDQRSVESTVPLNSLHRENTFIMYKDLLLEWLQNV